MLHWTGASEGPKSSDLHLDRLQIAHYSTTFVAATLTAFGTGAFPTLSVLGSTCKARHENVFDERRRRSESIVNSHTRSKRAKAGR